MLRAARLPHRTARRKDTCREMSSPQPRFDLTSARRSHRVAPGRAFHFDFLIEVFLVIAPLLPFGALAGRPSPRLDPAGRGGLQVRLVTVGVN